MVLFLIPIGIGLVTWILPNTLTIINKISITIILILIAAGCYIAMTQVPAPAAQAAAAPSALSPAAPTPAAPSAPAAESYPEQEPRPEPKPTNDLLSLADMQYDDFQYGSSDDRFYQINGIATDFNGNSYNNGIILYTEHHASETFSGRIDNDPDGATALITYPLNASYNMLDGKIVLPKTIDLAGLRVNPSNDTAVDVLFFGDGNLLHSSKNVTNTMPFAFSVDITGVYDLTIKIVSKNKTMGNWTYNYTALTDLILS
jgi:hypothetical protein